MRNNTNSEAVHEGNARAERKCLPGLPPAQIPAKELQRRQSQRPAQHAPCDQGHNEDRHYRRLDKSVRVPDRHVLRQAVTVVIHVRAYILERRIPQNIADHRADQRHQKRHRHVMPDQFALRKSHRPKRSDDRCFFADRIADRDAEHKRDNADHDIEQKLHHRAVAPHILAGKADRLIGIPRDIALELHFFAQSFHQVLAAVVLLFLAPRRVHIFPSIVKIQRLLRVLPELLRRTDRHSEFERVEHRIIIVRKHRAVIGERHEPGDHPAVLRRRAAC